jgi:hypothetical protein
VIDDHGLTVVGVLIGKHDASREHGLHVPALARSSRPGLPPPRRFASRISVRPATGNGKGPRMAVKSSAFLAGPPKGTCAAYTAV